MMRKLYGMLVLALLLLIGMPAQAQDVTGAFLGPVNAARAQVGAPPVSYNGQLVVAAQRHSNDMAANNFLSHTGSDGSAFWERMSAAGYSLSTGAENVLQRWDTDINGAFSQWFNSSGHRTNMLNADYLEIGVAYAVAADGRHYFTMVLGTRPGMTAPPVVQPEPTVVPPTAVPPTVVPPTVVPPTVVPPTAVPPTDEPVPTTEIPPTDDVSPTDAVADEPVPTTEIPPTDDVSPTDAVADEPVPTTEIPPTDDVQPTEIPPTNAPSSSVTESGDVTAAFLGFVNDARAQAGAPPVSYNAQLAQAAQRHSNDMASGQFMSHTGSDGSEFWERMADAGYQLSAGAENVLYRFDFNTAEAFQQWLNSEGHRRNMLNADYAEMGVAYARGADGQYYFTMVLGSRPGLVATEIPPTIAPTAIPPTVTPLPVLPTDIPPSNVSVSGDVTSAFLAQVNALREQAGTSPLGYSPQLALAAQRHSNDMAANGFLSHTGSDGSAFWERMVDAGYPSGYGGENVLFRYDLDTTEAFNQWFNSEGHRRNMLNPEYVEMGVAYALGSDGRYYFTMVLGYRDGAGLDDFAPPTLMPTPTTPPPTNTPSPIPEQPTATPTVMIPPTATATLIPPSEPEDSPLLPVATSTLIPPPPAVDEPVPTTAIAIDEGQPAPPTSLPSVDMDNPSLDEPIPELRLEWDARSFALTNIADVPLNIAGIRFESDNSVLSVTRWQTEFLSASLTNFPTAGCLQVWGLSVNSLPTKPDACDFRHAWIAVGESDLFWQDVERFTVRNNGEVVAECSTADGFCEISLTEQTVTAQPTEAPSADAPIAVADANVRLVYDELSLSLVNITDTPINLADVRFESDRGQLSIYKWRTDFLTASLSGFPAGDCLQVWNINTPNQPKPTTCGTRHAWIAVSDSETVWRNVDQFIVTQRGETRAVCSVTAGTCEFRAE